MYAITGLITIHVIDSSGPKSEVFSTESLWARLKIKNVQKMDPIVLWIQLNFYPNPDGPAPISVLLEGF
jgi:hypothetical protein